MTPRQLRDTPKRLRWRTLDGHRFLAGNGPFIIVRAHEASSAHVRFEVHSARRVAGNANGVCSIEGLAAALRPWLS